MLSPRSLVTLCLVLLAPAVARAGPPSKVDFNRDVRPILSENCFYCHGQDPNHRKADLRLDVRESALKLKAVVPGDLQKSKLLARIFADDPDDRMPPVDSHRTLTPQQKDGLKRWIEEGAVYQQHWAFVAPARPTLPAVKHPEWARNAIDYFVLARLETEGLS